MQHLCTELEVPSGTLNLRLWSKDNSQVAGAAHDIPVLLVHGLGAHSGWFDQIGIRLAEQGITAYAYDHCGFGTRRTEQMSSFHKWVDDLVEVYQALSADKAAPRLYANSMGALIALAALPRLAPVPPGIALFSPGFDGGSSFTLEWRLLTLVKAILAPNLEISLPYGIDAITQSPECRRFIAEDPLARLIVPAGYMLQVLKLTGAATKVTQLPCPLFLATAGKDVIVSTAASQKFLQSVSCKSKTSYHFEQAFHDMMFEPCLDQLVQHLLNWQREAQPALSG